MILVLTGMPGTGKSTVGRMLAARVGAAFHDLDARLAAADPAGRPAARILAEDGEPAFRAAEAAAVAALARELVGDPMGAPWDAVVATGGWTLGDPASRQALDALGPIVCLTAAPATLAARLRPTTGDRPLLPLPDEAALAVLLAARSAVYDAVPWQVATDGRTPEEVAGQVEGLLAAVGWAAKEGAASSAPTPDPTGPWTSTGGGAGGATAGDPTGPGTSAGDGAGVPAVHPGAVEAAGSSGPIGVPTHRDDATSFPAVVGVDGRARAAPPVAVPVASSEGPVGGLTGGYSVLVGDGLLDALGALVVARGVGGRAVVVSDANVWPLYGERVVASLERAGIAASHVVVPAGEAAKSPAELERLWGSFATARLERGDTVVALGGGVVTDLAGFAAATWLRGVRLVNVPTSLLGMVDAAVGGKTGIDLAAGKNLAGSFHPPALVVADVTALATLPPAERREGLAEVVKAAVIDGEAMLADLEAAAAGWLGAWAAGGDASRTGGGREDDALRAWIARAVAVKARIVGGDLREARGGPREALNLGHTFAHGLEAASGYALPHGQAVSIGLVAAARLAADLGEAPADLASRIEALLGRLGLPTRWDGGASAVIAAMAHDKKRAGGALRFVLPRAPGDVVVRGGVPEAAVRGVLVGERR